MVKRTLVEGLVQDGAKLLVALDARGFAVKAMFWVDLPEQDYWRLVVGSPIVATKGAAAGYRSLQEILGAMDAAGLRLEDISLLDPASSQFRTLLGVVQDSSRLANGPAWVVFEEGIVYRWSGAALHGQLTCAVSAAELHRAWDAARRRTTDLPGLLISVADSHITLRFHPQHGMLAFGNMKQTFKIALHHAFPECDITWEQ